MFQAMKVKDNQLVSNQEPIKGIGGLDACKKSNFIASYFRENHTTRIQYDTCLWSSSLWPIILFLIDQCYIILWLLSTKNTYDEASQWNKSDTLKGHKEKLIVVYG